MLKGALVSRVIGYMYIPFSHDMPLAAYIFNIFFSLVGWSLFTQSMLSNVHMSTCSGKSELVLPSAWFQHQVTKCFATAKAVPHESSFLLIVSDVFFIKWSYYKPMLYFPVYFLVVWGGFVSLMWQFPICNIHPFC